MAHANGGPDFRTSLEQEIGPYYLRVTASPGEPAVGTVHLTFFLTDNQRTGPVTDANIQLFATPPSDGEGQPTSYVVGHSAVNPDNYDTNVSLDTPGEWGFVILIDSPLGQARTILTLNVREGGNDLLTVLIIVMSFPLFLIVLLGWYHLRRWKKRETD
ncbi:MAG: hypothetical protein ACE5JL_12890 [Dehalococcoidia bacterium]